MTNLDGLMAALDVYGKPKWMELGACRDLSTEVMFPERGASHLRAKQACADCPVRPACLEYALTTAQRFGVWGGTSERERRAIRKARGISPVRPIPHGTESGYRRCRLREEGSCDACKEAHAASNAAGRTGGAVGRPRVA